MHEVLIVHCGETIDVNNYVMSQMSIKNQDSCNSVKLNVPSNIPLIGINVQVHLLLVKTLNQLEANLFDQKHFQLPS